MPRPVSAPKTSRFVLMASVCVVIAALYFAQAVLIPLALAMLFSFLLAPVVQWLERRRIGRVPSVLITVIVVFALVGTLAYVVWTQVYDLADKVDQYSGNITAKIDRLRPGSGGIFAKLRHTFEQVQEKVDQSNKAAATQATQPAAGTKVVAVVVGTAVPTTAAVETSRAVATTQWTWKNPLPVAEVQTSTSPLQTLGSYIGLVLGPLGTAGVVVVFVIFMLLQREDLRNRLIRLMGRGQLTVATTALDDASSRISRYLTAQAIVNGTYGVTIALGLWIIGLTIGRHDPSGTTHFPNVILWGLLCAILRFIPYIGPWIAAAFPVLIALAVYKGFGVFGAVLGLFVIIELGSNNLMEPWLYGSSTGMSTVAILVSAVFWTWLWGAIGLLMATPLTVVLVVLGKYVPQLQFLDVLLGDEPVLEPPARVYQRLLALDAEEALEVVQDYRREMPLEQVYDTVLMPALALAEQDRHKGLLDDRRQRFLRESMRDIVEEMGDQEVLKQSSHAAAQVERLARGEIDPADMRSAESSPPPDSDSGAEQPSGDGSPPQTVARALVPKGCTITIVCLPAHDEGDEICNLMLAQLLELRGYCAFSVSHNALASEMIAQIESHHADITVVSALPPAAVAHARYLCKRVHARFPDAAMAVGLWNVSVNLERARERITCVHSVQMVTTLSEMQTTVDQLAHSALLKGTQTTEVTSG